MHPARQVARRSEKIDFLEEHVNSLVEEVRRKSRLLQHYLLREEAGALATQDRDQAKVGPTQDRGKSRIGASQDGGKSRIVATQDLDQANVGATQDWNQSKVVDRQGYRGDAGDGLEGRDG